MKRVIVVDASRPERDVAITHEGGKVRLSIHTPNKYVAVVVDRAELLEALLAQERDHGEES